MSAKEPFASEKNSLHQKTWSLIRRKFFHVPQKLMPSAQTRPPTPDPGCVEIVPHTKTKQRKTETKNGKTTTMTTTAGAVRKESPSQLALRKALVFASHRRKPVDHPLYKLLASGEDRPVGWLRHEEHRIRYGTYCDDVPLDETDNERIYYMKLALSGSPLPVAALITHAWGLDESE